jgi:hypothetical protein
MLCFSVRLNSSPMYEWSSCQIQVDSPDSLENVETKWVGEIAENCPGVKLVLVALKCDLRKRGVDGEEGDGDDDSQPEKPMINYDEGLKVAEKIKALRYLGTLYVPCYTSLPTADMNHRMFRNEEQRCQRGLHRSRTSRTPGQIRQRPNQRLYNDVTVLHFQLPFSSIRLINLYCSLYQVPGTLLHIFYTLYLHDFHWSFPQLPSALLLAIGR